MKNEMNEIPTPETTFRYDADKYTGGFSAYENMRDHACDLERRLTVAREALQAVSDAGGNYCDLLTSQEIAEKALTLTALKA